MTEITTILITEINEAYDESRYAACEALGHAMRCGALLNRAKTACAHGEWQQWLSEHFDGSARTARVYMQLAANRKMIEAKMAEVSAVLTIDGAAKLLAAPKAKKAEAKKKPLTEKMLEQPKKWTQEEIADHLRTLWAFASAATKKSFVAYISESDVAELPTDPIIDQAVAEEAKLAGAV